MFLLENNVLNILNPSIVTVYERSNYYKFLNRFFLKLHTLVINKLAAIVIEYFFSLNIYTQIFNAKTNFN